MKKFELGLFVGRFQPFHKGHLSALKYSLLLSKKLIIGIGSSDSIGTEQNPISSSNRIKIIKAALKNTRIDSRKIKFIKIPDFNDDEKWFHYIMKVEPRIDIVFSRNKSVTGIFKKHGIRVILPPWHARNLFLATKIRRIIKNGKHWQDRVPKGAVSEIAKHQDEIKKSKDANPML